MAGKRNATGSGKPKFTDRVQHSASKNNTRKNVDLAYKACLHLLYDVLACLHHVSILSSHLANGTLPNSFKKEAVRRAAFQKPAVINSENLKKRRHLRALERATFDIQEDVDEYNIFLQKSKSDVFRFKSSKNVDFNRALDHALYWGQKNFGTKLVQSDVDSLTTYISASSRSDPGFDRKCLSLSATTTPLNTRQNKRARLSTGSPPLVETKRPNLNNTPPPPPRGIVSNSAASLCPVSIDLNPKPLPTVTPELSSKPNSPPSYASVLINSPTNTKKPQSSVPGPCIPGQFKNKPNFWQFRQTNRSDWHIPKTLKNVFLLGSSNISRVDQEPHPQMTIVSLPGADFNSIRTVVSKFRGGSHSYHIILNIGINNKDTKESQIEYQMRNMISAIRQKFRNAKIYFQEINHSELLTMSQKKRIEQINRIAKTLRDVEIIARLPSGQFKIDPYDKYLVHWDKETASKLYNKWLSTIDLN